MMRRVVITGTGVVSAFGCEVEAFWNALCAGRSAVRALDDSGSGIAVGAPVCGFSARTYVEPKSLRLMAPAVSFGVAAAELAVRDSGLRVEALDPARLGAFIASRGHSSDRQDLVPAVRLATQNGRFQLSRFGAEGLPIVPPMWLLKGLANNVLYFVSLKYNAQGMNSNLSLGGVGATMAIGEAFEAIRRGYADMALAGGYDSALDQDRLEMYGSSALATRSTDPLRASRPFDGARAGFVPGEGAGMLMLESLDLATARGARISAEVIGYGSSAAVRGDGALGPSSRGFAKALEGALEDAEVPPDAVFAHGLATTESDIEETQALKIVFGPAAARIPAPAIKSMIGNTFAASGALETVAALGALRAQSLPPTINLTEPDPACDLDYVAGTSARAMPLRSVALVNANLGGGHAALVLRRLA